MPRRLWKRWTPLEVQALEFVWTMAVSALVLFLAELGR